MFCHLRGCFTCFVYRKGTLEGALLCFMHQKGTREGTSQRFVQGKGTLKSTLPHYNQGKETMKEPPLVNQKGTLEGASSCFFYHRGIQKGTFARFFLTLGHQGGDCPSGGWWRGSKTVIWPHSELSTQKERITLTLGQPAHSHVYCNT